MALAGEAGELTELFQWLTPDQSLNIMQDAPKAEAVRDELADIFGYCLRLADILGVDLEAAFTAKMAKNALKYPVHLAKGSAAKYTELKP
jgi:NTP pyrophosphatase (non-canonical NTP hydrolase)